MRSAARGGDAAYWASWADAKRNPVVADKVVAVMVQEAPWTNVWLSCVQHPKDWTGFLVETHLAGLEGGTAPS